MFQAVWDFIVATFTPMVQFFSGATGALESYCGRMGAAVRWISVAYRASIVGVFSVVASWLVEYSEELGML